MPIDPAVFPTPLSAYPPPSADGILATLAARVAEDPFNLIVTAIFAIAILHTFAAARFTRLAHALQHRHAARLPLSAPPRPSVAAELLHFFGEVEVVFGLWAVVLIVAITAAHGWTTARHYVSETVNYTEPLFVVVIMALASTRPIIGLAERSLHAVARLGGATPAAWWVAILTIAPMMGSFITEPAAMTIAAVLLGRQFYDLNPGPRLKYATLGLLFVNVSVGGTLTHFAAPPVLMVARHWDWDTVFMATHFGWRAALAIVVSTPAYFVLFRGELRALSRLPPVRSPAGRRGTNGVARSRAPPIPVGDGRLRAVHRLDRRERALSGAVPRRLSLLPRFRSRDGGVSTLASTSRAAARRLLPGGLVIHGDLQAWWIAPCSRA